MKFLSFLVALTLLITMCNAQNVGIGTNAPNKNALLELKSSSKGILIPRLTTTERDAITSPTIGLQIFNITDTTINYFNGLAWVKLKASDATKWSVFGNAGINADNNFIGTTDANDFVIKTNGSEGLRLKSLTPVTSAQVSPFDVLVLTNPGTNNNKWPLSASFRLGSYAPGINALTQMDIVLGNNSTPFPDTRVMSLYGNGDVNIAGTGIFGQYLKIGTDVAEGYFQNSQDGAYRSLATGGDQGFYFQNTGGVKTSLYVGLNGLYQGKIGIGTATPVAPLTIKTNMYDYGLLHTDGNINLGTQLGGAIVGIPDGGLIGTFSNHPLYLFTNNSNTPQLTLTTYGNVGIGTTTPHTSAALDIATTEKGFLMPRMTTAQRDAIAGPAVGLQIFNLDDQCTDLFDGANWIKTCGLKVISSITDPGHPAANSWIQKANFGGMARTRAIGFSIGNKGYTGTGLGLDGSLKNDFWEYDPATNAWTQKANFGGTTRYNAVGFSIGSKGYTGTGDDGNLKNDFWEYDPAANTWTQKANFGGTARYNAVGFSIGSKGYIGTGVDAVNKNDFWEYDPAANTWTQKANFGGTARRSAVGFSMGGKGYIGTGFDSIEKNDFWEYNPGADAWTQKAPFGGSARFFAVGFSTGSKGYIGTGLAGITKYNDFWEYDPAADAWTPKAPFGGTARAVAVGFSIGSKGYIGTGSAGIITNDFWEYLDNNITGSVYSSNAVSATANTISDGAWTLANGTVYNANKGNVGIGIAAPLANLHINNAGQATRLIIGQDANTGGFTALDISTSASSGGFSSLQSVSKSGSTYGNIVLNLSGGNVGIGTNAPNAKLSVNGFANNTTGAWGVFSDARLKTISNDFTDGLNVINQLHPVKFRYNADAPFKTDAEQIGIVAQELEKLAPYMVTKTNYEKFTDLRQVNNQAYTFLLINAVKTQQAEIEALKATNESMMKEINKIKAQLVATVPAPAK
jgi:hypothetical protein